MIAEQELNVMSKEQISEEIKKRNDLIREMVGTLYPSIIRDEIGQLYLQISNRADG